MYLSLSIALLLPLGSTVFLIKYKEALGEDEFKIKYNMLYKNLEVLSTTSNLNFLWLAIYLIKRFILALITILLAESAAAQIICIQLLQLVSLMHHFKYQPMSSRALQKIEVLNEVFILISSCLLPAFTPLVPSVATRSSFGTFYMYLLLAAISLNLAIVVYHVTKDHIYYKELERRRLDKIY